MKDIRRPRVSALATLILGAMTFVMALGLIMALPAKAQTSGPGQGNDYPISSSTTSGNGGSSSTSSTTTGGGGGTSLPTLQPGGGSTTTLAGVGTTVVGSTTTTVAKHGLAFTGADITMTVGGAAGALGAGGVLILVSRKRKTEQ